nr:endothelial differentiation-related factor 1 [Macaca nemestrina]
MALRATADTVDGCLRKKGPTGRPGQVQAGCFAGRRSGRRRAGRTLGRGHDRWGRGLSGEGQGARDGGGADKVGWTLPPPVARVEDGCVLSSTCGRRLPVWLMFPRAILAAQRRGEDVETSKKWAAGQNKQHSITKNTAKLDRETEELHHDRVTLEVGKVIQQGRQSKGLTQKDLATKINEKPQVIADYESGRAIPNNQVLGKIERAIGLKLRGKDIGKPIEKGPRAK